MLRGRQVAVLQLAFGNMSARSMIESLENAETSAAVFCAIILED